MPITGPSSYIVVVPLFLNHWEDAEAEVGAFVLDKESAEQPADVARGDLVALYEGLVGRRDVLEGVMLEVGLLRATLEGHRVWLQAQALSFNQLVRADHGTSIFARNLPPAPQAAEGRERFMKPLRLVVNLWTRLNEYRATLPVPKPALTLQGGTTLAAFTERLEVTRQCFNMVEEKEQQETLERERRNDAQEEIYPVLRVYRLKIEALFPEGGALRATLPALTDDGAGTPEPGSLAGVWNATTNDATLTGTPSPSATVVRHQIRASLGEEPDAGDETLSAEFALGQELVLITGYGLGSPGARAHFRLVAITADGHEKGSAWVTIQRPL